jgi:hypothetical protein
LFAVSIACIDVAMNGGIFRAGNISGGGGQSAGEAQAGRGDEMRDGREWVAMSS